MHAGSLRNASQLTKPAGIFAILLHFFLPCTHGGWELVHIHMAGFTFALIAHLLNEPLLIAVTLSMSKEFS